MLELNNIVKKYSSGDSEVVALNGVNLKFRKNEFVSILGASGCGKTTMLNIIGGLDRYTDGDLIINGVSTKEFKDRDWDTYRNHSIGFVFQSYNLIPHQTVLSNVELALTLSGVSKAERRQRAKEALIKVGLGDQLNKKPSQMSGGQMQRVAIARALVNNPEILLADEPTGALDTATSVQIMDLLKEVAKDRLVIMVTHNPELAAEYSTRIVRLSDGVVIDDTQPYEGDPIPEGGEVKLLKKPKKDKSKGRKAKTSMSFLTAISLSMKNLLTKKGRTILTSFAGSIGIIGIALVLSLSNGINLFITQIQEDTLSTYPLTIQKETQDMTAMMSAMMSTSESSEEIDPDKIYVDNSLDKMVSAMTSSVSNDLASFKTYLEAHPEINDYVSDIQYTYAYDIKVFNTTAKNADGELIAPTQLGMSNLLSNMGDYFAGMSDMVDMAGASGMDVMSEMIDNDELLDQQYEVVAGAWPSNANEVVLVVGKNNQISKLTLYMLGVLDQGELEDIMATLMSPEGYDEGEPLPPYNTSDFVGMNFYMLTASEFYEKTSEKYSDGSDYYRWREMTFASDEEYRSFIEENGEKLTVSGIVRPRPDAAATSISGAIGYTAELTELILEKNAESEIIKQQKETPTMNVITGLPLDLENKKYTVENVDELFSAFDANTMAQISSMMGGMLLEDFNTTADSEKLMKFITYATLINDADKQTLALMLYDKVAATAPTQLPMLYMTLNQNGIFNIDSREDLAVCLPSIANDSQQYGTLLGLMANICQQNMGDIYEVFLPMLSNISVSREFCVNWIRQSAEQEKENTESATGMTTEELINMLTLMAPDTDATYDKMLKKLGDTDKAVPASINFYAKDFNSKEEIETFISDYNKAVEAEGNSEKVIEYTDVIGVMMSGISTIIDVISYVLIAFVSISLVVSSIMIGIITNISVLERIKEIGILRAIGASKKDISRVFNAETFIIGLVAGVIGIVSTVILCIPVNIIIQYLSGFSNINASMPWLAGIILVLISMGLTMIAGLIPARNASKKDPVEALRSE
ncbi:MAG: ABC transporter ATP-binding protein/permease [Clostridia bacterium]|nr:ABC transporter ATP-binding protein/permease [Clostridia bacterium]